MPNTRKKNIKTVYKDDESSENEGHDFSDSGSEAVITDNESSDDEEDNHQSSEDDFQSKQPKKTRQNNKKTKAKFTKSFINKIYKQDLEIKDNNNPSLLFSVKDLSDADKLLPSVLNLSESDSSDDDSSRVTKKNMQTCSINAETIHSEIEPETKFEYKDVWAENVHDNSEEIAKRTFIELEQHKSKIEETKLSVENYNLKNDITKESEVKDLLALGEDENPAKILTNSKKRAKVEDSDSDMEDWEEVNDVKGIPQQGLQLIVGVPDGICRKTKKIDIEMMMKRKMNRVKKEYQVYMHKVHVLCWLGHGNYVSQVLNDQDILAASLSLVPSKECYPGERVDIKYVEQITSWYKDKVILKQDKHENKFKPKAPPLKELLLQQIKSRVFSTNKYVVFVFVSMLRSLGLQCRAMFNFVTLPIRPPSSELCSLSTKKKDTKDSVKELKETVKKSAPQKTTKVKKGKIEQLDGNCDSSCESDYIMQIDGSDDNLTVKTRRQKQIAASNTGKHLNTEINAEEESVSPPKRAKTKAAINHEKGSSSPKKVPSAINKQVVTKNLSKVESNRNAKNVRKSLSLKTQENKVSVDEEFKINDKNLKDVKSPRKTRSKDTNKKSLETKASPIDNAFKHGKKTTNVPKILVSSDSQGSISSKYFESDKPLLETKQAGRKRSRTSEPKSSGNQSCDEIKKQRTRSAHNPESKSKYFNDNKKPIKNTRTTRRKNDNGPDNAIRISHKDLTKQLKSKNDVTSDLVTIIKGRVKEAKDEAKKGIVKEKIKQESDVDSDYLPVESPKQRHSESDDDFKPVKFSPKLNTVKKVDRRVLSTDDELPLNKIDTWCEVFVEELEEWVAVDVIKGKVHCVNEIYSRATHPVNYVIGWDNNNYLKDLTRRYVPHWNTVTRKQRVESIWWEKAVKAWLGPKSAKDREEDERLDRMQLEAPLPKSIAEYKNHPLYALKRHLLKFETIYPPDAATLGFVRGEAVYARDCVYVCRSRDTWLKEAKIVKLGEHPYKVVKARPKWDKLSNKLITDKPLEIFGPWQVQDYEPPVAENGVVPRNPYGNVELFKECMLPKGTVHIKLPGLNRIAKKLNIDCAPAMTGFEFNGGWSHPVYDGFVVCQEFEQVITEAWLMDQEEQERKEIEKTEARVYSNWKKLIRGLLIRERLKAKYGFEEPSTSNEKKTKGPRLVIKKK